CGGSGPSADSHYSRFADDPILAAIRRAVRPIAPELPMRLLLLCLALPVASAGAGEIGPGLLALECTAAEVETCTATDGTLTAILVRAPAAAFRADVVPVDREAEIAPLFAELCPDALASIIG